MSSSTTIGQVFLVELSLIKLCGGLPFEGLPYLSFLYRLALVILSRFLASKSQSLFQENSSTNSSKLSGASLTSSSQNVPMFINVFSLISHAKVFVTLYIGWKYHNLLRTILEKRLGRPNLSGDDAIGKQYKLIRFAEDLCNRMLSRKLLKQHTKRDTLHDVAQHHANDAALQRHGAQDRVRTFRKLFVFNILLTALTSILHQNTIESGILQQHKNTTRIPGLSAAPSTNSSPAPRPRLKWLKLFRVGFPKLRLSGLQILIVLLETVLNINQTYAHSFVILMITASLSDMINFSSSETGLTSGCPTSVSHNTDPPAKDNSTNQHKCVHQPSSDNHLNRKRETQTLIMLLIHARDVLLVVRCIMSLDQLMLMIFDLSRLMEVVYLLSAAVAAGRSDKVLTISLDYICIAFNMGFTRLGYHWLHIQANKLKRTINERTVYHHLKNRGTRDRFSRTNNPDHVAQTVLYRLADNFTELWPTDWFTPDLKGYLKQNIFVITLVATLQQLMDAGSRFEH